jgi:hypothetical protein
VSERVIAMNVPFFRLNFRCLQFTAGPWRVCFSFGRLQVPIANSLARIGASGLARVRKEFDLLYGKENGPRNFVLRPLKEKPFRRLFNLKSRSRRRHDSSRALHEPPATCIWD